MRRRQQLEDEISLHTQGDELQEAMAEMRVFEEVVSDIHKPTHTEHNTNQHSPPTPIQTSTPSKEPTSKLAEVQMREPENAQCNRAPADTGRNLRLEWANAPEYVPTTATSTHMNPGSIMPPGGLPPSNLFNSTPHLADQSFQNFMSAQQGMYNQIITSMNMPKKELLSFRGNSLDYWKFICNFDTSVGSQFIDSQVKLSYLIQYCEGEAKDCIDHCVILDPSEGYLAAHKILDERYGRPHVIARSYITNLVEGEPLKANDWPALLNFSSQMNKCQLALQRMGYRADLDNCENLMKCVKRLPNFLRNKWVEVADRILVTGREPHFADLATYVEGRARVASSFYGQEVSKTLGKADAKPTFQSKPVQPGNKGTTLATGGAGETPQGPVGVAQRSYGNCVCCDGVHSLDLCDKFKGLERVRRVEMLRRHRLCFNCFKRAHIAKDCFKPSNCTVTGCTIKHHALVHPDRTRESGDHMSQGNGNQGTAVQTGTAMATGAGTRVCLKVVPVIVSAPGSSKQVKTYALLDDCSDVSLCSADLAESLGVSGRPKSFSLSTVNQSDNQFTGVEVSLLARSPDDGDWVHVDRVWTIDNIPTSPRNIPAQSLLSKWPHLKGITIPELDISEIKLLIGCTTPEAFWVYEQRRGGKGDPVASLGALGWSIIGPLDSNWAELQRDGNVNFTRISDEALQHQVSRMWTTDFNDAKVLDKPERSVDDNQAVSIMESSVRQGEDGHYELSMPYKRSNPELRNNLKMAEGRLNSLKARLRRDPDLHEAYTAAMEDNLKKGYASKISDLPQEEQLGSLGKSYLPHHPVLNPNKPGKVRIVYDCAAKYAGKSLNDELLQGPDLTNTLVGVLIRFRQHPVAVMGDIREMFNQVRVSPLSQRDHLRFLWWPNDDLTPRMKSIG